MLRFVLTKSRRGGDEIPSASSIRRLCHARNSSWRASEPRTECYRRHHAARRSGQITNRDIVIPVVGSPTVRVYMPLADMQSTHRHEVPPCNGVGAKFSRPTRGEKASAPLCPKSAGKRDTPRRRESRLWLRADLHQQSGKGHPQSGSHPPTDNRRGVRHTLPRVGQAHGAPGFPGPGRSTPIPGTGERWRMCLGRRGASVSGRLQNPTVDDLVAAAINKRRPRGTSHRCLSACFQWLPGRSPAQKVGGRPSPAAPTISEGEAETAPPSEGQ